MTQSNKEDYRIVFDWDNQAKQYPLHGSGTQYFKGKLYGVDCLLYYGDDNLLWGILNHYPETIPYRGSDGSIKRQEKGSVNIQIRPDKRRLGIATKLLNEAMKRYNIDLHEQDYTDLGAKFIRKYKYKP